MAKNLSLNKAGIAKEDEFYTQLNDIENEMRHYKEHFRNKVILSNCDDPYESNFFKYFAMNFDFLGLKKLVATCYAGSPVQGQQLSLFDVVGLTEQTDDDKSPYKIEITEVTDENADGAVDLSDVEYLLKNKKNLLTLLKGDGDFRSAECIELLKQSDIIVTNPPFSMFREYVTQLINSKKHFIVIGNQNAITYKEIFKLLRDNKIWLGNKSGDMEFIVPDYYQPRATRYREENGVKYRSMGNICWFTNLDHAKRHENITLFRHYTSDKYPHYDNYDAINVDKVVDIPVDWLGFMGVPITFLDRYNPEQFQIFGLIAGNIKGLAGIESKIGKDGPYVNGKLKYGRIIIKRTGATE